MHDKIRAAFGEIHAEEELKNRTRAYIAQQMSARRKPSGRMRLIPALACCLFVLLAGWGGHHIYFSPSSIISIDVNPSLELGINRFDKVISVEGYNDDGAALANAVDVKYLDYAQALTRILESDAFAPYTSGDAAISIAVFGSDEEKNNEMLSQVEACTAGYRNAHCYADDMDTAAAAHAAGLSCGKYRAYLALQALDPAVTPEDIQGMTMREIRDRIADLSGNSAPLRKRRKPIFHPAAGIMAASVEAERENGTTPMGSRPSSPVALLIPPYPSAQTAIPL